MLFDLLAALRRDLDVLIAADPAPAFLETWQAQAPGFFDGLRKRWSADETARAASLIAGFALQRIAEIPRIARAMEALMERENTHPAVRCAMIGSLAYLVQPRDLLPDDLPGGYGYLDDCLILRTTLAEYFDLLPADLGGVSARYGGERAVLSLLAMCLPARRLPLMQGALDGVWHLFQRLLALPGAQAQETAAALIADPLDARLPVQGFTAPYGPAPDVTRPPDAAALHLSGDGLQISLPGGAKVQLP